MSVNEVLIDSIQDKRLRKLAIEVNTELKGKDPEAGDQWLSTRELKRVEQKIREYYQLNPPMLDPVEACVSEDMRKIRGNNVLKDIWKFLTTPGWKLIADLF